MGAMIRFLGRSVAIAFELGVAVGSKIASDFTVLIPTWTKPARLWLGQSQPEPVAVVIFLKWAFCYA
jgi:hypothetical protein